MFSRNKFEDVTMECKTLWLWLFNFRTIRRKVKVVVTLQELGNEDLWSGVQSKEKKYIYCGFQYFSKIEFTIFWASCEHEPLGDWQTIQNWHIRLFSHVPQVWFPPTVKRKRRSLRRMSNLTCWGLYQDLNAVRSYFTSLSLFCGFFFSASYDTLEDKTQDKDITSLIFSNVDK